MYVIINDLAISLVLTRPFLPGGACGLDTRQVKICEAAGSAKIGDRIIVPEVMPA